MKCLCPVFQKYYNALRSINEMKINNNFFDNIASVDNFFSEYRNITFVLQKQLKTQDEKQLYEELKLKYLRNDIMKWFVDTRNEIQKEHSFELKKRIIVDVYYILKEKNILNETLTIDDCDLSTEEIKNRIKDELSKIKTTEPDLFLTIRYVFLNKTEEIDIYEIIKTGLNIMHDFIFELEEKTKNDCKLCEKLKENILEKITEFNTKRMELITDCSYNVNDKELVFYDKGDIIYGTKNDSFFLDGKRMAIKENILFPKSDNMNEIFESFIIMHTIIYVSQQKHIMPTFLIIYSDMTFSLDSFFAFTKATIYRKVNEIAKKIEKEDIVAVMFVGELLGYSSLNSDIYNKPYEERIKNATKEMLTFTMINDNLEEKNIIFDTNKIEDMSYVLKNIKNNSNSFLGVLLPIQVAFTQKKSAKC